MNTLDRFLCSGRTVAARVLDQVEVSIPIEVAHRHRLDEIQRENRIVGFGQEFDPSPIRHLCDPRVPPGVGSQCVPIAPMPRGCETAVNSEEPTGASPYAASKLATESYALGPGAG